MGSSLSPRSPIVGIGVTGLNPVRDSQSQSVWEQPVEDVAQGGGGSPGSTSPPAAASRMARSRAAKVMSSPSESLSLAFLETAAPVSFVPETVFGRARTFRSG